MRCFLSLSPVRQQRRILFGVVVLLPVITANFIRFSVVLVKNPGNNEEFYSFVFRQLIDRKGRSG